MKHTRGPWKIIDHDEDHITITDDEQYCGVCKLEEVYSESRSVTIANTHLIAAAPDMYEALEKIRYYYNNPEKYPLIPMSEIRDLISKTIAKARGEK